VNLKGKKFKVSYWKNLLILQGRIKFILIGLLFLYLQYRLKYLSITYILFQKLLVYKEL